MSDDFNWDEWARKRVNRDHSKAEAQEAVAGSMIPVIVFVLAVLAVVVTW